MKIDLLILMIDAGVVDTIQMPRIVFIGKAGKTNILLCAGAGHADPKVHLVVFARRDQVKLFAHPLTEFTSQLQDFLEICIANLTVGM